VNALQQKNIEFILFCEKIISQKRIIFPMLS
jgi:hypothetical protein